MAKADEDNDKSKYGEEAYKANGSPMFGRLWSFNELATVERPGRRGPGKRAIDREFKRPDNWPGDTEVEPGTWVSWLPEGWAQGIRTQVMSGKKLSCYMNPEGKRFWHKKDIEKHLGRVLPSGVLKPVEKEEDDAKKTRYVTDPDAIPNWPEDEEDWLPKDFKIGFRQLPSGLHRVFVPPGKEEEGFLYHKSTVMQWLAGEVTQVSPFGTSKPMAEISAEAANRGGSGSSRRKRKLGEPKLASPKDFEDIAGFQVVRLGGMRCLDALREAHVQDAERLATDAEQLQDALANRNFEDTTLLYVFQRSELKHPVALVVAGFYFKRTTYNDHEAYQKITPVGRMAVACSGLHICWSIAWEGQGCWKIGKPDSNELGRGGYAAICADTTMQSGWKLLRADLFRAAAAPA